jgi:hypothetical protein
MEIKQTAVDWLVEQFEKDGYLDIQRIQQAKEMEKEQMFEYINKNYVIGEKTLKFFQESFEKYYNDTYKS